MIDIQDFYVLGIPIETEFGECRFITVKDYPKHLFDLQVFSMSKNEIIYKVYQDNKKGEYDEFLNQLERSSLFDIVASIKELQIAYSNIFKSVFDNEKILNLINEENFDYYRNLIMKMNAQKEEYINPNPEIQKHLDRSKRVKSQDGEYQSFGDMVVSVVVGAQVSFNEIKEWTIYQLYMAYHGVDNFKNYDTTTLFATVSSKTKVQSWSKHIDLFKQDTHSLTMEQFNKHAKIFEN